MTWEQHRYAIERARDRLRKANDAINDCCVICDGGSANECACTCPGGPTFAGATLQGEALSSDAEMLDDVADFLQSLDGSKAGDLPQVMFTADWNQAISHISVMSARYGLHKPEMIFHHSWLERMRQISGMNLQPVLIYGGVKVRFGHFEQADVFKSY